MTVKLSGGAAPFSVIANGSPALTGQHAREVELPYPGAGFSTLVVVDRNGRSDRVTVWLD